ncbi:MAG: lipopolysaccharide assembly protein LapB, partial [Fluviibacter sp.]
QAAYDFAIAELHRTPSLIALNKALEARAAVTPAEQLADLELVKKLVKAQTQRLARYTCKSCGFKARQFYWRCPACSEWESYPPKRSEEFALMQ